MCSDEELGPLLVVTEAEALEGGLRPRTGLGVAREGELPVKAVALSKVFDVGVGVRANAPVVGEFSSNDNSHDVLIIVAGSGNGGNVVVREAAVGAGAALGTEAAAGLGGARIGNVGSVGNVGSGYGLHIHTFRRGCGVQEGTDSALVALAFGEEIAGNIVFGGHCRQKGRY